ncbi:hypothetical protein R3P38DRAFT_2842044 [Favolaschia claudopus]|uniref:Uncharacterized protein n=1 Tax=Favolaschia claudopus TaxID=2862362 RepID=A0AAW0E2D0_9AGAR
MTFFNNSSNFQITGGTFNVIHGDLNQEHHVYSTYISNAYSQDYNPDHFDDGAHYDPWPPQGGNHRRRSQRHRERGEYGHAQYYTDRPQSSGRFETLLQSPESHVEISGGDFHASPRRRRSPVYQPEPAERFSHVSPVTSQETFEFGVDASPNDPDTLSASLNSESSPDGDEAEVLDGGSATASPVPIPVDTEPAQKYPTRLENMRRAMANMQMDVDDADTVEAMLNTSPSTPGPSRVPLERNQPKRTQSFAEKVFPFRPKSKP